MPIIVGGPNQNVNRDRKSPGSGAERVVVYPGHKKNYFFVPMGIVANTLQLAEIYGADSASYVSKENDVRISCTAQGVVSTGLNQFRTSMLCPTLAIPDYIVMLPSSL
jgi:hypothetical protein